MRSNTGQILYIPRIGQRADFQHPLMRGCLGWWPLTDGAGGILKDISGNGLDATLNGTNTWETETLGTVNRFDNSSSNGNNARTANTQPDLTSGYTVTFWVKHEDAGATVNKYGAGLALTDGSSGAGNWWNTVSSDLEIYFNTSSSTSSQWPQIVHNRNNGGSISAYAFNDSTRASQNNVWKFWAVTFDGTNARIYREASLISTSGTLAAPLSTTGKHIVINGVADTATGLTCSMQNVRLWSRALLSSEILELYTNPWAGLSIPSATRYFFVPQLITASPKLFNIKGSSISMTSNTGRVSVRAAR
jgi:hypothetical protein